MSELHGVNIQSMQRTHTMQHQKMINNLVKKWAEDLNRHFSNADIQMANKHEKILKITIIGETQIKTTMRHHLKPLRVVIFKNTKNSKYFQGWVEKRPLMHCW